MKPLKTRILVILTGMLMTLPGLADNEDPWLWLEEIDGKTALDWVMTRNAESLAVLQEPALYETLYQKNLAVYNSNERIAYPTIRGSYLYNFWRDEKNTRGLWRRTTLEEYHKPDPAWEILLDVDALAEKEGENWVWKGSECLPPHYELCLLNLSRGGADATVKREFDLSSKSFITENAFNLPESKGFVSWIDADNVFVSTDFGEGSMTDSGYPRTTRHWKRGTPLAQAKLIHEGKASDIGVYAYVVHTPEADYPMVRVSDTFFTRQVYLLRDGELKRLDIPDDADIETIFNNQLLISLKTDWQRDDQNLQQGELVSLDLDNLLAGEGRARSVMKPDARSSISQVRRTRNAVLINRLEDVRSRISAHKLIEGEWRQENIKAPKMGNIYISSTAEDSDLFFFTYTDFLTPTTLYQADAAWQPKPAKSLPAFFDGTPYEVSQHFVKSADGTRVPYFMVARKDLDLNAKNPTLIYAYGGFEVSRTPSYSATIGMDWLDQGGVYVLANIRGGGEYGPQWHLSAIRENRQRSYDDFYAVAEDLIERKVTAPRHLGIRGGSGGGLLVGMLFTQRPDLFNAVVCQVPLLDMKRFNKLLAGASWVAEYGDPDNPDDWAFLQNYSPYHNLDADTDYPRVFFTTSTRDDRVHPGHARKMVAKMRAMDKPVFYYENTEGGHGGAADNEQQARVQALIFSYLVSELN
jgi:prolyl oligopeptidase